MELNRPIDITTYQRELLLELIAQHLPNTEVWAHGSRVKWSARPSSDLDLVVFSKPDQNYQVSELREAMEQSNLPFRVDLLIWDSVPERFRQEIKTDHVVIYNDDVQTDVVDSGL